MIAEIIPLKRLPAHLHRFDYSIPDGFHIAVGDLVTIPWRAGTTVGVVALLKDAVSAEIAHKTKKCKPLSTVNVTSAVTKAQLETWHSMAMFYHVSEATLAKTCVPLFPKKKSVVLAAPTLRTKEKTEMPVPTTAYFNYANESMRNDFVAQTLKKQGQHVLVVPNREELSSFENMLTAANIPYTLFYSELTPKQKRTVWCAVRTGETRVVLGTKSALFLPFSNLTSVIIDKEWSPYHKNWDAQPLYHATDAARIMCEHTKAKLVLMSTAPTVTTYGHIKEGAVSKEKKSSLCAARSFTLISLDDEKKRGNQSTLSEHVRGWLEQHPNESVFFFLNQKGSGHTLQCADCGATGKCKTCKLPLIVYKDEKVLRCRVCHYERSIPLACPVCQSVRLAVHGMGTQRVRDDLTAVARALHSKLPVIQLDSDAANTAVPEQGWFIGTEYAMTRLPWHTLKAVVVINIDAMLLQANYRASEQVYARLIDFLYRLQETGGALMVQTHSPQHTLFAAIYRQKPALFFDEELATRTALSYPPATFVVRMEGSNPEAVGSKLAAHIKEKGWKVRMEVPYGKIGLLLRFSPKNVQLELSALNALLPDDWKVDPNPIVQLS